MDEDIKKRKNGIIEMLKVGNDALNRYRNLIGIGVFLMLLSFSFIFMYSLNKQEKIAESCGFTDGKLKCICTEDAWNQKMEEMNNPIIYPIIGGESIDLNNTKSSDNEDG